MYTLIMLARLANDTDLFNHSTVYSRLVEG